MSLMSFSTHLRLFNDFSKFIDGSNPETRFGALDHSASDDPPTF